MKKTKKIQKERQHFQASMSNQSLNEQFRIIRTNINFTIGTGKKLFLVTSGINSEGKSTIVANLAISFAQQKKRILLIDADLRHPTQHRLFNMKNDVGVSTILSGQHTIKEAVQTEEQYGIDLITSGVTPPNPSDLLASEAFSNFLIACREHYDYIFIDSTPLIQLADAKIVMKEVDASILVIRANRTSKSNLLKCKTIIDSFDLPLLGYILNDSREKKYNSKYYMT
ncbi:CpsD/CapB family tyrosine-protein kinase [Listeria sp. PSOL-1]|uniref:CpsD/CapB family tyrosine-protein kinase n=1 Tax=Listeria sp. PSOL-1 TaxID=1844999 RepID=UPI0013D5CD06|nr:CpsD/CapB family tyrosine-protein kinase [Listeria sp. PSOL-1]